MQYALNAAGEKILAQRGIPAICSLCQKPLFAKCGAIKVHHWSHEAEKQCDSWFEPETEWHRAWKSLAPVERVEVIFGDHRADMVSHDGMVIELQHSSISPEEIQARENHYKKVIWIVDGMRFVDRFHLMDRFKNKEGFNIHWKNMHKQWLAATKPVFFDFGNTPLADLLGNKEFIPPNRGTHRQTHKSAKRIEEIEPALHAPGLLLFKKHTLHRNGRGSVLMMTRAQIIERINGASNS